MTDNDCRGRQLRLAPDDPWHALEATEVGEPAARGSGSGG